MRLLTRLLDLLFPPACLRCEQRIGVHGTLCTACWQQLAFISEPCCGRCGLPFEFQPATAPHAAALCGNCLHAPPSFATARAVLRYDAVSRPLLLRLKYQDDTTLAATYGPWLARASAPHGHGCDLVVPVPLHYVRFLKRRYNQAALLAHALSRETGLPCLPDALTRTRATSSQTGLTASARQRNVQGAFRLHPRHAEAVRGKTILLIDDVYTTGATLNACAEALLAARAREVRAITLARRC